MYKPVIVKKEVNDEHYYYVNGVYMPSVTKILGETMPTPYALRQWIGDVGNEKAEDKLNKAAARGSAIHSACETLLLGGEIKLLEQFPRREDQKCIVSFVKFLSDFQPKIDKSEDVEFPVASELGYAGTLDIKCRIDPATINKLTKYLPSYEHWIIDIKTSSSIYDSHKLQLAAYQAAYYEMFGIRTHVGILHLNPKTIKGYSFHVDLDIKGTPVVIDDFMKVFEMYRMLNGGTIPEPPLVDEYPEIIKL